MKLSEKNDFDMFVLLEVDFFHLNKIFFIYFIYSSKLGYKFRLVIRPHTYNCRVKI